MTRYTKGAYFERRVKEHLERCGWWAIRAAGSHGVADIVAALYGEWQLIQCKVDGKIGPAERKKLRDAAELTGGRPMLAWRSKRGEISFKRVEAQNEAQS